MPWASAIKATILPSRLAPILMWAAAAGPVARGQMLLDAVEEHLHRPAAGLLGEFGRRVPPQIGTELGPEAAPHVIGVNRHIRAGTLKTPARSLATPRDVLRARPGHGLVVALFDALLPFDRQAVRFQANVGDHRHRISAFDWSPRPWPWPPRPCPWFGYGLFGRCPP